MQGLLGRTLSQSVPWALQSRPLPLIPTVGLPCPTVGVMGWSGGVLEEEEPKEMPTPVLGPSPSGPSTGVCGA